MIRLAARGIDKNYDAVAALSNVDFDVVAGAVNVLIGENGAGKSTLMRILAGVETPDGGELLLDGKPVAFRSIRDAAASGISIVFQELSLCPNLTVTENIFLDRSVVSSALLDHRRERERAAALLQLLGTDIDPNALLGSLRVGEQQLVELARALSRDASVLILDEPTSALSSAESERLFTVIDDLRTRGVAIVYISHRMHEIEQLGDYVTVLRDGRRVAAAPKGQFSTQWIVRHMLGGTPDVPARAKRSEGPVGLNVSDLSVMRANGNVAVDHVSLGIRSGEITAVYGLLGAGRSELFEAICGARACTGSIKVEDNEIGQLPLRQRLERGIQFVAEDRQSEGIFPNLTVAGNLTVPILHRLARRGWLAPRHETGAAEPMMERMRVKASSPAAPIHSLSGGNQQKALIARALLAGPKVVVLDEPTRGVDVGARAEIFETMRSLAAEGIAVLFSTSDVAEALSAADRILVMAGGKITADVRAEATDEAALLDAASAVTIPTVEAA